MVNKKDLINKIKILIDKKDLINKIEELKYKIRELEKEYNKLKNLDILNSLNSNLGYREIEILEDAMNLAEYIGINIEDIDIDEENSIDSFFYNLLKILIIRAFNKLREKINIINNDCVKRKLFNILDEIIKLEIKYMYDNSETNFNLGIYSWDDDKYWENWIKKLINDYEIKKECRKE